MADLYEVLQVHPKAEPDVIRAAYRILARKYHPDLGGDQHRMIALNDAWDVLGDPERRAEYDASRVVTQATAAPSSPSNGSVYAAPAPAPTPASTTGPAAAPEAAPASPSGSGFSQPADGPRAGPPPGRPSGTVLDFGRYAGWSLGEVARYDRDYLEWLSRATFARRLRSEIEGLLRGASGPAGARVGARR